MTWRDRDGRLNFVFCDDGRAVDDNKRDGEEEEKYEENMSGDAKSGVRLA
jgi:hypothetical protein